ncbi:hypothetical protein FOPE_10880 [Fonsecaea pedrosoi]|nr:hypothetical protein FOPE_10880 [Fonsecaea pedrosoi]
MGRTIKPQRIKRELGLSNQDFIKFKQICRDAQRIWRNEHPQSKWANIKTPWGLIPEPEIEQVVQLVWNKGVERNIFRAGGDNSYIKRMAIQDRLQAIRQNWYNNHRRKAEKLM